MFKPYPKVQALHKEECEGLLNGTCIIQEKIDGANASIWMEEDGIHCGSRTRDLTIINEGFNGFKEYVENHDGIKKLLEAFPGFRLYGEWLVRHTIGYSELAYKHFYLYEIENSVGDLISIDHMYQLANAFGIKTAELFAVIDNPPLEEIQKFAGKSVLGEKGEGVVVKNFNFINKFGNRQHGKYVTQEFKEDNAVTFGGNNKSSDTYHEMYYVNKYMTLARVQKIIHKMEATTGKPDYKDIPKVMGLCLYDLITEEAWAIANDMFKIPGGFNFGAFKKLCDKKSKQIFIEIITNSISVAHYE